MQNQNTFSPKQTSNYNIRPSSILIKSDFPFESRKITLAQFKFNISRCKLKANQKKEENGVALFFNERN